MIKKLNTFTLNYTSEVEGNTFVGKFTAHIASIMDKTRISVRKSQLLGGMYCVRDDDGMPTGRGIDEDTEFRAHVIAWLEVTLVQKPDWFKLEGEDPITDEGLLLAIFTEVMKFENSFRGGVRGAAQGNEGPAQSSEGAGATQSAQANAGNGPPKVVDKQVSPSLDP